MFFSVMEYFKNPWKLLRDKDKRVLVENFFSLSFLQFLNYLFPLITFPYLVRVLGVENMGIVTFSQSFIQYFVIFTDFGFNLSATRDIAVFKNNKKRISQIFFSVFWVKFLLTFVAMIVFLSIIFFFDKFRNFSSLYICGFGIVLGNVLTPSWFFQGIEKMKIITAYNFISKLIVAILIVVFIRYNSKLYVVNVIYSFGYILSAIFSLLLSRRYLLVNKSTIFSKLIILNQFKSGLSIFFSNVAISLYTTSTTVFLGFFTDDKTVGRYVIADKIAKFGIGLIDVFSRTIFPYVSRRAKKMVNGYWCFLRKMFWGEIIFFFMFSIALFLMSDVIVYFLLGYEDQYSSVILKVLSFLPFVVSFSNIFGVQIMLNMNMKEVFLKILAFSGFVSVITSLVLVRIGGGLGIAFSVLGTEVLISFLMGFYLLKKGFLTKLFKNFYES